MKKTNSERYQASFDKLHLSDDFRMRLAQNLEKEREDSKVNNIRAFSIGRIAAIAAVFTLACGSVCYAADLGGIRTTISLWIHGEKESVEVQDMGDGAFAWTDENGENHGFGGYSYTEGEEIKSMSAEDMSAYMNNSAELEFKEDRILFHYHNLTEDVTDRISPDKKLYVHVEDPANPNTYFGFSEIGQGTYSMECTDRPTDADYYEADATGLISQDPAAAFDEDTEMVVTTQVSE